MKKITMLCLFSFLLVGTLSSCSSKNPVNDFINEAKQYYNEYLKKYGEDASKEVYYYDGESMRCVVFNPSEGEEYKYLGLLNIQNFTFSEYKDEYFFDLGNLDVEIISDSGNLDFAIPEYMDENKQFSLEKFLSKPPFVLLKENDDKSFTKFSQIDKNGEINKSADVTTYDTNLFYIDGFEISLGEGLPTFDYSNKYVSLFKRDLYELILEQVGDVELPKFLDLKKSLLSSYRRVNNLDDGQEVVSTLNIPGEINGLEVVVGPMSYSELFGEKIDEDTRKPFISNVDNIFIEEGVKEITFFALDNALSLKNLYLPGTLKDVQFSGLSNLNLDNLYIGDGDSAINFVDLGDITIPNTDIAVFPGIGGTKINKAIVFENYDNPNLYSFPYYTLNYNQNKDNYYEISYISNNSEIIKELSLEEALETFDRISSSYFLKKDENNEIIATNVSEIKNGKTVYIDLSKENSGRKISRQYTTNLSTTVPTYDSASTKIKLDNDLTIKGNLILSGTIGNVNGISGRTTGEFTALDLNGHTITIEEGGLLEANGLIVDNSVNQTGNIVVKNNGTLKANFGINDYYGFSNVNVKLENKEAPFLTYNFYDIDSPLEVENGGALIGQIAYVDNTNYVTNEVKFVGSDSDSFIQLKDTQSKFLRKIYENREVFELEGNVSINEFDYNDTYKDEISKEIAFPIVSKSLEVVSNGTLNVNTNLKILPDGKLTVNNLRTSNDIYVYDVNNVEGSSVYPNLNAEKDGLLRINGLLLINEQNNGHIFGSVDLETEESYNSMKEFVKLYDLYEIEIKEGAINYTTNHYNVIYYAEYFVHFKNSSKEYIRKDKYNYYEYSNNKNDGALYYAMDNNNELIAEYKNNDNWFVNDNDTNVSSSSSLDSFNIESRYYALIDGKFQEIAKIPNENNVFELDGKEYIELSGKLIEGNYQEDGRFLIGTNTYLYANGGWKRMYLYENGNVLVNIDKSLIYYKKDGTFKNNSAIYYDLDNHYLETTTNRLAYVGENMELFEASKETDFSQKYFAFSNKNYIYYNNIWMEVNSVNLNNAEAYISDELSYCYTKDNMWVEARIFRHITSEYNFVFLTKSQSYNGKEYKYGLYTDTKEGDRYKKVINYIAPDGKVDINKEDYEEFWSDNVEGDNGNYVGYRHFIDSNDGKKKLFYKNLETSKVELRTFEFAPGFTPVDPGVSDTSNVFAKLGFIKYEVVFEGEETKTTIYLSIDQNDLVICGDSSIDSEYYLAFGTFSLKNPIDDMTTSGENSGSSTT